MVFLKLNVPPATDILQFVKEISTEFEFEYKVFNRGEADHAFKISEKRLKPFRAPFQGHKAGEALEARMEAESSFIQAVTCSSRSSDKVTMASSRP